jgi:hypothetical protein
METYIIVSAILFSYKQKNGFGQTNRPAHPLQIPIPNPTQAATHGDSGNVKHMPIKHPAIMAQKWVAFSGAFNGTLLKSQS